MKVSNKSPNALQNPETARTSRAGSAESLLDTKKTKGGGASGEAMDASRVQLSTRAQDMARAKELATPSNDIDEAKVARLQKMIDQGAYKVDSAAIADRLLDEQMKMTE